MSQLDLSDVDTSRHIHPPSWLDMNDLLSDDEESTFTRHIIPFDEDGPRPLKRNKSGDDFVSFDSAHADLQQLLASSDPHVPQVIVHSASAPSKTYCNCAPETCAMCPICCIYTITDKQSFADFVHENLMCDNCVRDIAASSSSS